MTTQPDGGPAFPVLHYTYLASGDIAPEPTIDAGMTLRDWFAGQALANPHNVDRTDNPDERAGYCYAIADAMLAARATKETT